MANRYTVVVWQSAHGFLAVIPALGMAPVVAGNRREAVRQCREIALNRLTVNAITGVPMPPDVKVSTDHVDVREDGQVRSFSSQYVPCINTAMAQIVPQFASDPAATEVIVEMFSELISMLRETMPEASTALAGGPMSEAIWTPADLVKFADELLDERVEFDLSPAAGKQVRRVVQEHMSRALAGVIPLDAQLLGVIDGMFPPLLNPFLDFDGDEPPANLDMSAFEPFLPPLPQSLPASLGPLQHPPDRRHRKRT